MAPKSPSTSTSFPATAYPDLTIDPKREIRLVTIHPGQKTEHIKCTLSTHGLDLDDSGKVAEVDFKKINSVHYEPSIPTSTWRPEPAREYFALSYCWGSFEDHGVVRLNDIPSFPVSHNLWCALRRLRSKLKKDDPPRRYWIDQLCINQHDISERNQQVQIMAQIFHQAFRVYIWLFDTPEQNAPSLLFTERRRTKLLLESSSKIPTNLRWWERAWVIQEFLVARYPPMALYGPCEVEWNELPPRTGRRSLLVQYYGTRLASVIGRLYIQSQSLRAYGKVDMDEYFEIIVTTQCFDPRDKIYSLLGLINGLDKVVSPDYEKGLPALFTEVTQAAIECSSSLDILATIARCDTTREEMALPTWVVNFAVFAHSQGGSLPHIPVSRDELRSRKASAWCQMGENRTTELSFHSHGENSTLKFKGVYFDEVLFTWPLDEYSYSAERRTWRQAATDFTKGSFNHVNVDVVLERSYNPSRWNFLSPLFDLGNPFTRLGDRDSLNELVPITDLDNIKRRVQERAEVCEIELGVYDIVNLIQYWRNRFLPKDTTKRWDLRQYLVEWRRRLLFTGDGSSLLASRSGFIGLGPKDIREGDQIALPFGCQFPLLLANCDDSTHKFKGVVLVEGVMGGKLAEQNPPIKLREDEWTLI